MKRKNRKINTSNKRCRELTKFKIINPSILMDMPVYSEETFTVAGVYTYGKTRHK
jgi:hypothetical protein